MRPISTLHRRGHFRTACLHYTQEAYLLPSWVSAPPLCSPLGQSGNRPCYNTAHTSSPPVQGCPLKQKMYNENVETDLLNCHVFTLGHIVDKTWHLHIYLQYFSSPIAAVKQWRPKGLSVSPPHNHPLQKRFFKRFKKVNEFWTYIF